MYQLESEKLLDKKLSEAVKDLGGWCIKLVCTHISGLPDRLCLLPGGKLFFAEVKTTKEKPKKIQIFIHNKLINLGFKVYVIDSTETLKNVLAKYENTQ